MGAGRSLEAAYDLGGPIQAGPWLLVSDAIITEPVDVTIELLLRSGAGDSVLVSFEQQFEPLPDDEYAAQAYEQAFELPRVEAEAGDQLVLRYTGAGSADMMAFIPNGDGANTGGRIPYIDLPPD